MVRVLGLYAWQDGLVKKFHGHGPKISTPATPPDTGVIYAGPEGGALGFAKFPIPSSDVIYVSTTGSDANNGLTLGAPKLTLMGAYNAVPPNGTIVARSGIYDAGFSGALTKTFILQPYYSVALDATEIVWVDGSRIQTVWDNNGDGTWSADIFYSPNHTVPGGYEGGQNIQFPMAVWTDMVHIDGVRQQHRPGFDFTLDIGSSTAEITAEVPGPGEFTMDSNSPTRVTIGTNPAGKEVRLSYRPKFGIFKGAGTTLKGIGVRRFATSLTGSDSTVDISAANFVMENCMIEDCGQQSVSMRGTNNRMVRSSISGSSQLNFHADRSVGLIIENSILENSNFNGWDNEPGAGGFKAARTKDVILRHNVVRDNNCNGIWFDVSCYNTIILNNKVKGNRGPAIEYEISRLAYIVNNWIEHTSTSGSTSIWALDGRDIYVWNNMIDRATSFDARFEEDNRAGVVSVGENPDGVQTWTTENVQFCNNVLANYTGRTGVWRLYFNNISIPEDAKAYFSRVGGNYWSSPSTTTCARMAAVGDVAGGDVTPTTYTSPSTFATAVGSTKAGTNKLAVFGVPDSATMMSWAIDAEALPSIIAGLMNVSPGARAVGPVLSEPQPTF